MAQGQLIYEPQVKDPDSILPWKFIWTQWLTAEDNDTIDSVAVTTTGGLVAESHSIDGGEVTVWMSGGTVGKATCTCHIVTSGGREEDATITISIKEK